MLEFVRIFAFIWRNEIFSPMVRGKKKEKKKGGEI